MFRIFAHTFLSHIKEIQQLDVEAHLNSAFKHFYLFVKEHKLMNVQDMAPLQHVIDKIEKTMREEDEDNS